MGEKLMSGFWRYMLMIPPFLWEKQISKARERIRRELGFMSAEHRLVHHSVVRELPRAGNDLSRVAPNRPRMFDPGSVSFRFRRELRFSTPD